MEVGPPPVMPGHAGSDDVPAPGEILHDPEAHCL